MGTYLCAGICTKIQIVKKDMTSKKITLEEIIEDLQREIELGLFDKEEDEDTIYWSIKRKYIEYGLIDFLKSQYEIYNKKGDYSEYYREIEKAKTYEKILELAKKPSGQYFHRLQRPVDLRINKRWQHINVYYDLIVFLMEGKILMECYEYIFHYFEYMIRLQKDKYPITGAVKIVISL